MVSDWWSNAAVIHDSFMGPGSSIMAELYCQQLKEAIKQPTLANNIKAYLLHGNVQPHTSRMTPVKLQVIAVR